MRSYNGSSCRNALQPKISVLRYLVVGPEAMWRRGANFT